VTSNPPIGPSAQRAAATGSNRRVTGFPAIGSRYWSQDSDGIQGTSESGDRFGFALAAGDFNGYPDDLAIGVPLEDLSGKQNAGAVNVIYGTDGGLSPAGNQFWSQDTPGIHGGVEKGDRFGTSLAVGNFDGDLADDLAIGVPYEDINGWWFFDHNEAGAVNVIYGSIPLDGSLTNGLSAARNEMWYQNSPGIKDESDLKDHFGMSLATGDFDGDGRDDLAIGVPHEDFGTFAPVIFGRDKGAVNVIYGSPAPHGLTAAGDQFWTQASPGIAGKAEKDDRFGMSLAAGNFGRATTGDDLAIGVPGEDVHEVVDAGSVNVIYGIASYGLHASGDQSWHQEAGLPDYSNVFDSFGYFDAGYGFGEFSGTSACCMPPGGRCDMRDPVPCLAAGGLPMAVGSACPLPYSVCHPPACCFPSGGCSHVLPEQCMQAGGSPQGDFTECSPDLCPPGIELNLNSGLEALLAAWGPCPEPQVLGCPADLDGDGTVGVLDLLILLDVLEPPSEAGARQELGDPTVVLGIDEDDDDEEEGDEEGRSEEESAG
jgi:hypothetical protein